MEPTILSLRTPNILAIWIMVIVLGVVVALGGQLFQMNKG